MDIKTFLDILVAGLRLSSIYFLMAVGLTLVYGVGQMFNYAHGTFFTWGAYICWFLLNFFDYKIAFILTIPAMFLFGLVFERLIIYPLRKQQEWQTTIFICTLGSALFLNSLALVCFGPRYKTLPPLLTGELNFGVLIISWNDILLFLIVIFTVILLTFALKKSRLGMSVRAVSQDAIGAKLTGIQTDKIFSIIFAVSAVLAGIAGMLITPRTLLFPSVGWPIFMKAFVIVVFGGLGSVKGSLYASLILGMTESVVAYFIGGVWGLAFFVLILVIVLVNRPRGLFGMGD